MNEVFLLREGGTFLPCSCTKPFKIQTGTLATDGKDISNTATQFCGYLVDKLFPFYMAPIAL